MKRIAVLVVALSWTLSPLAHAQEEREVYVLPSGDNVSFDAAAEAYNARLRSAERHWGRAVIEEILTLALGAVWYWSSRDLNSVDWDIDADIGSIARRFTSTSYIRFDTNRFFVNQGHVLAGAMYYGWARANDLRLLPSLLYAVLTSAAWEYLLEFREYISLNDLVTSPYGGQAVGEVLYKWGELYHAMGRDLPFAARALTIPFASVRALHHALGDEPLEPWDPSYGALMQHDFRLRVGASLRGAGTTPTSGSGAFELRTKIVDIPGHHYPGDFDTFFADGNITRLDLSMDVGADSLDHTVFTARAVLAGYYDQSIGLDGSGHAFALGVTRGAWMDLHETEELRDRIAMVDMVGPALFFDVFIAGMRAELSARAFFDLGAVTPHAYQAYREVNGEEGVRSELVREGYYFAYGGLFIPGLLLELGPFETLFELEYGRFANFYGPDRIYLGDVPTRLRILDERIVMRASLALAVFRGAELRLRLDRTIRRGITEEFVQQTALNELGLTVGYRF